MKRVLPVIMLGSIACGSCTSSEHQKEWFREQRLTVPAKSTVAIKGTGVKIHNEGCGRAWINDDAGHAYEKAYCTLTVKSPDSSFVMNDMQKNYCVWGLCIQVDKVNPWGVAEDSVPAGGVRLIVKPQDQP